MSSSSKLDNLLSVTRQAAEALAKSAAGCGVVGIEAAGGVVVVILNQLEIVKENADACAKLVDKLADLTTVLEGAVATIGPARGGNHAVAARLGSTEEFKMRVENLLAALRKVEADVLKLLAPTSKKKIRNYVGTVLARDRKELLKNLADTVIRAKNQFSFRNSIAMETILLDLEAKVVREAEEARLAREQERLARAQEVENAKLAQERARQDQEWNDLLGRLAAASVNAEYSSMDNVAGPPLQGTRVALLEELDEWATHDSSPQPHFPFFVLTGGAGTGKSTIAYEVARRGAIRRDSGENGQLAASFFFTRGSAVLDSADRVFTTLARQMLTNLSALRPAATSVIEEYLRIGDRPKLEIQAKHLFVRLLSKLPPNHPPILLVIDAVDECADPGQAKYMMKLVMDGLSQIPSSVRVFVTSRPEIHIEHALRSDPFTPLRDAPDFVPRLQRFRLHEIPQDVVDSDIQLYFETELLKLQLDDLFENHPIVHVAQTLTRLSAGLFIFAATLLYYLRLCAQEGSVPDLKQLLDGDTSPKLALERLGKLYAVVLKQAPLGASDQHNALASMKAVLGYLAVLQDHVSPNVLIALSPPDLRRHILPTLRRLAPVLSFDPEHLNVPVRPLHASFVDFLLDSTRCHAKYLVSAPEQHLRLATSTLMLLKEARTVTRYIDHLKNFCLSQSLDPNAHSGPSEFVPDAMEYACLYWPAHVTHFLDPNLLLAVAQGPASPYTSESDVQRLIHDYQAAGSAFFVPVHIIHWIEVLGYLQSLGTATYWLPPLHRLFEDVDRSIAVLLYDAYRLVVTFHPALVDDPRQLYISALPQCPNTSPLRARIPPALAVPQSLLPYPAWSLSVTHEADPLPKRDSTERQYRWLVRPSPDGRWVAASLRSGPGRRGDIHLRDATTGIFLRTLRVHASALADFGISSDSRFIVSATRGGEICITDSGSGITLASCNHTDGEVTRIAFRCNDSELILVYSKRGDSSDRPVRFLILDWERTERTEGGVRPRRESHGLRDYIRYDPHPWSISPDGRWGVFWATGELLDLRSFAEVKLSFIPDTAALSDRNTDTCGTWLSPSLLVCSVLDKDECRLIVVDIGQDIKEVETRAIRSVPTRYKFSAMEASANGSLVALHGQSHSGFCIFLWDTTEDDIRVVKHIFDCGFCLSPHGDALYLAVDSTWSVIPTSQLSIAPAQPLHPFAVKFSATRDMIMVATQRPAYSLGWEVGILSRGFSSSPGTVSVVSRHYFGRQPCFAALTPDPHLIIFPNKEDIVLHSVGGSSSTFSAPYPDIWLLASMPPNLARIVACGSTPATASSSGWELTFAEWDTKSASLLHAFRTPWPSPPNDKHLRTEIVVTEALDIHYLLDHNSFVYRYSDWSTSDPDKPRLLPRPEPGPVPGEWFQIGDDGWVTRSDGHPEVGKPGRGREKLFWVPPSQRVGHLWRGDQHLLAMTTEYDVIVLDLSAFDDDTKEQHVPRLQIENE